MSHAIADSDDEGDDIELEARENANESSASGNNATAANGEGAVGGTNDYSTGSTERLRRNILSAERGLITDSTASMAAPGGNAVEGQFSSASPSTQAQKGRHTSVTGTASSSPDKKVKRTKTLKTYGSKRPSQASEDDDGNFERLRDEEAAGSKTSQRSTTFSEHSKFHSSAELPAGSLQTDFMNHEPTVMFRDTGSTVEDTSSAQKELLEQALGGVKTGVTSAVQDAEANDSSSLAWWSASEQTPAARSCVGGDAEMQGRGGDSNGEVMIPGETEAETVVTPEDRRPTSQAEDGTAGTNGTSIFGDGLNGGHASRFQASPTVEIEVTTRKTTPPQNASAQGQKSTRSRKRKAEEQNNSEPLNSDDKAIGLPKERYQPRPSRRRATAAVEESIDYSMRPEKAAKAKRTKTTNDSSTITKLDEIVTSRDDVTTDKCNGEQAAETGKANKAEKSESQHEDAAQDDSTASEEKTSANTNQDDELTAQPPQDSPAKPSSSLKTDDQIFVEPAKPTPKPKSASKAKRFHTTIFEDHVEFAGSKPRSPSLNQQQAKRKSALKDVENDAPSASSQRRRKIVVEADADEEQDELALGWKRGEKRGRRTPSKPLEKSADNVTEDSKDDNGDDSDEDEAPTKRARGRSAKTAPAESRRSSEESSKSVEAASRESNEVSETTEAAQTDTNTKTNETAPKPVSSAKDISTPSPDQTTKPAVEKENKPSPTSHSPIKSSSKVPYRVGLSKRHHIPSLLRTMQPPKR